MSALAAALATCLVGAFVAGPAAAYGLSFVPARWTKPAQWVLILGAVAIAIIADLLVEGPGGGGAIVYLLAILPGLIAYLVFRTLLASALVSLLPLSVVRQAELFRRAMQAYLTVMLVAYAGFLMYPTVAPRPAVVEGTGFAAWGLRLAYEIDPPHGCFPSLHVAYSFVSALTCYRVHRGVGIAAALWAALIGVSTLFTKQHYVVDVIAGMTAAFAAYALFLRAYPREAVEEIDRRRAPVRALAVVGLYGVMAAGFWVAYRL